MLVAASDSQMTIADPEGLDIEALVAVKRQGNQFKKIAAIVN